MIDCSYVTCNKPYRIALTIKKENDLQTLNVIIKQCQYIIFRRITII